MKIAQRKLKMDAAVLQGEVGGSGGKPGGNEPSMADVAHALELETSALLMKDSKENIGF